VVLADGSAQVRNVLRWLLQEDGRFEVVGETADGEDAVAAASDADVVVMEIALRGLDGLTALQQIGRVHPSVAVVIYSSYAQPYLKSEAVARGAAAFITKSSGYDEIAETLATAAKARD
jgi:DNA-binding NarL/FixJ family response regulator